MLSAKNELTSTVELATADGHLAAPAMYSFPQRYLQARFGSRTMDETEDAGNAKKKPRGWYLKGLGWDTRKGRY